MKSNGVLARSVAATRRLFYRIGLWLAVCSAVLGAVSITQADYSWSGSYSGDWNNNGNWVGNQVPQSPVGNLLFYSLSRGVIDNANSNLTGVDNVILQYVEYSGEFTLQGSGSLTMNSGGTIYNATGPGDYFRNLNLNFIATGTGFNIQNVTDAVLVIGASDGSNTITLPSDTMLTVSTDHNTTINSTILGDGGLVKDGLGILWLKGVNTFAGGTAINAGTVALDNAHSLPSTGAVNVASGATLQVKTSTTLGALAGAGTLWLDNPSASDTMTTTVHCDSDAIFSGTISSNNANEIIKSGDGRWTFGSDAQGSITRVIVNAGDFDVNGVLQGPVTINSGGWLSGTGTVGALMVNSGGGVAPGNSIGVLNVHGDYTHNAGATYAVQIDDHNGKDQIHATGHAYINGGTVDVQAQSGNYSAGMNYRILVADGGVSGTGFSNVTDNLPFLDGQLQYGGTYVDLILFSSHTPYVDVAQTGNQYAVADYLDVLHPSASGDLASVMQAFNVLTAPEARAAFDQLAGEPYADLASIDIAASNLFSDTAFYRMATIDGLDCGERTGRELWIYGLGNWQRQNTNGDYHGYSNDIGGFMIGYDKQFEEAMIGFGAGYGTANNAFTELPDNARTQVGNCSFYGKREFDAAYLSGVIGYTHGWNNVNRLIQFDSLSARHAIGAAGGDLLGSRFETGYNIYHNTWRLTPLAGLRYVYASIPQTTETGADSVNLAVGGYSQYSLASAFGAKVAFCVTRKWRAETYAQWEHEFGDTSGVVTMSFAGSPSNFTVQGVSFGRDAARTGVLLIGTLSDRVEVNFNYEAFLRSCYAGQQCVGGLSYKF